MKFSIVTSFYNTSEYVDKLYNSVLSQTYQNWEWIVTDDFSEVSAKNQLLELSKKDSRVKYIDQEFKQEIYWNPHKYSSPDTDFIIQFDSDDTYDPKLLEVYKHFFMLYPDVSCLVSGGQRKYKDGRWKNYLFGDTRYLNSADSRTKSGPSETMLVTRAWRHIPKHCDVSSLLNSGITAILSFIGCLPG
jgi:glycosyltransferase involved in cell wall biosynthesis